MIEVIGARVTSGARNMIRDASLKMKNGRIYGVFGLRADEVSSLMRLLAGAVEPEEGSVRVNGFDLWREGVAARKCLGYLPLSAELYPDMTVYELLDFVAEAKGISAERRFLRAHEWMERLWLGDLRNRRIALLNPVELVFLRLAQACVGDPDILILEDPFGQLNGGTVDDREAFSEVIEELAEQGKTVFLSAADSRVLDRLANEVLLVEEGRVLAPVPAKELLQGICAEVSVFGDRERVISALSAVGGLFSCGAVRSDEFQRTVWRVKSAEDRSVEIREALTAEGLKCSPVIRVPASAAEEAYRQGVTGVVGESDGKGGDEV
ncbi:MAG: ABC transporter ATP-binding protein [Ruminococcaceae bacterium]|nr:ABC transporter ATP-binding protein [Oscillospiraceae bacterium]